MIEKQNKIIKNQTAEG